MGAVSQNIAVKKIQSLDKRVLQKRNINGDIIFSDPDITFGCGMNGANTGNITITFAGDSQDIISRWNIGNNANLFKTNPNTTSINKNMGTGIDNNGTVGSTDSFGTNYIYLSNPSLVTNITFTSNASTIYSCRGLVLNSSFPNLKRIDLTNDRLGSFGDVFSQPSIEAVVCSVDATSSSATNLRTNLALSTTLKWLKLNGYTTNLTTITDVLPASLKYLEFGNFPNLTIDLGAYFNNRVRCGLACTFGGRLTYTGGALFPSVITEDAGQPVNYILYQNSNLNIKLTSNEVCQFFIDFANQVTSVTTNNKIIRLSDTIEPNSFPGYAEAKEKIRRLGITISFS